MQDNSATPASSKPLPILHTWAASPASGSSQPEETHILSHNLAAPGLTLQTGWQSALNLPMSGGHPQNLYSAFK